ncbi:uncharacterized protein LOC110900542 [Helianthus annuus]|uniref:uncharacterized protein LOC110900542 n=1 Tax=Helianthus annuus TaxID=4232 RepID=UPI000B8F9F76|nr:uncharacterized protein LOC110900542 [Helianthus annuus]
MLDALKGGPWIIRSQPLFLCEWNPTVKLEKKEVKKVQVWVKIHDIPIAANTEDGLSMIATTIGEPKLLDSYTTSMCMDMWGRSSYARALIEVSADKELREEITLAIPELEGEGFVKETMYVEYEWYPSRCSKCCVFGHSIETCPLTPKKPDIVKRMGQNDKNQVQGKRYDKKYPVIHKDGYQDVPARKVARKQGFQVNKQKQKFEYRPVIAKPKGEVKKDPSSSGIESKNPFAALNDIEGDGFVDSDSEEVMEGVEPPSETTGESHVDIHNLNKVCSSVFRRWDWTSNGSSCQKGTRIIAGWDPGILEVILLDQSSQVMHFQIIFKQDKRRLFCSVVYAANYYLTRREVWHHLSKHKVLVGNNPWVILGDFNSALHLDDKSMGASNISPGMRDFQECVSDIEVFDINSSGMHFTWNQKPKEGVGLLKKIDRIMGNTPFVDVFPNSVAFFHPNRLSDHCPCLLKIPATENKKHQSFKFANFLVYKPGFIEAVKKVWENNVVGVQQFQLVKKLRLLKRPLRALLFQQGNLHKKVETLRGELDAIQREIDRCPSNLNLRNQETRITAAFQEACLD